MTPTSSVPKGVRKGGGAHLVGSVPLENVNCAAGLSAVQIASSLT